MSRRLSTLCFKLSHKILMKVSKNIKDHLGILLFFTVLSCVFFWPIFLGKVNLNGNLLVSFYAPYTENLPFKNGGWDQLRIYFPFYKVTLDSIKSGQIPLWNPYAFSGHPYAADFQSAVFYPLNIFGLVMSQIVFWHFLRLTPTILAAFFTFIYLRNLKLSCQASLFGAITFGFSPFILTWGEEVIMSPHSIIWLPLILFGIDRFYETGRRKFLAIISLGIGLSLLGGYMQTSIYLGIFVAAYFIFRFKLKGLFAKRGFLVVGALVLGALIAAVQIFPSAELFFRSARSSVVALSDLYGFLLPINSVVTYLVPDFFGHPATLNFFRFGSAQYYEGIMFVGVAAFLFAFFEIYKKRRGLGLFLVIFGLVSLSTTLDLPTSRLFLILPIPFLSTSIANRILFIPAFCLAICGALGFARWQATNVKMTRVISYLAVLYLALLVWVLSFQVLGLSYFKHASYMTDANLKVSFRNFFLPFFVFGMSAFLIFLSGKEIISKKLAGALIIAIAVVHIFYFSQKYFSFSDKKYDFGKNPALDYIALNQGYFRSWSVGSKLFQTNFASQYGIYSSEGYDSLNNRRYGEFTHAMQGNDLGKFIFRADAGMGTGGRELLANPDRRKLLNLVGVKYVISDEDLARNNFKKVFDPGFLKFGVFENPEVLPRVFLASNFEKASKDGEIIKRLLADDFDLARSVVLEEDLPISPQAGEGSAEVISYKAQEVIIKTKSAAPKLLFISDNFYPGWKAKVDGDETKIWRADYTFRAVPLTAGEHTVRFYFDSSSFKIGALISVLSLLFLLVFVSGRFRISDLILTKN